MLNPEAVQRLNPLATLFLWLSLTSTSACAGSHAAAGPPVDLWLEDSAGEAIAVQAMRGRALVLFLFATYDGASQLAITPLSEAARERSEMAVLGIAVQPDADDLIGMFRESLGLEIPIVYEPDGEILAGQTALGRVPGVPYYVLLDREGRVVATHLGVLLGESLDAFLEAGL